MCLFSTPFAANGLFRSWAAPRPEDEEVEEDENPFERIIWPLFPPALPKDGDHYQPPLYKPKNLPQRYSLISIYKYMCDMYTYPKSME